MIFHTKCQYKLRELHQACHLDILMKTQGEKTKTQEFSQNTKNTQEFKYFMRQLSLKTLFKDKFFHIRNFSQKNFQKLKNFLQTQAKMPKTFKFRQIHYPSVARKMSKRQA